MPKMRAMSPFWNDNSKPAAEPPWFSPAFKPDRNVYICTFNVR